jgi:hypothetical protein
MSGALHRRPTGGSLPSYRLDESPVMRDWAQRPAAASAFQFDAAINMAGTYTTMRQALTIGTSRFRASARYPAAELAFEHAVRDCINGFSNGAPVNAPQETLNLAAQALARTAPISADKPPRWTFEFADVISQLED